MMRCTCPHYHIPSADPNDSRGCPVHDPEGYKKDEERKLRAAFEAGWDAHAEKEWGGEIQDVDMAFEAWHKS